MEKQSKSADQFESVLTAQRSFFSTGATRRIPDRIEKLKVLHRRIQVREQEICAALYKDFKKPPYETLVTEVAFILNELSHIIRKVGKWSRPKKVKSSWLNFPSSDFVYHEPYGACLVLAPWNYPFQLVLSPTIGALAAGNTVVLKPSEFSPNTSTLIAELFQDVFEPQWVSVVQGEAAVAKKLLSHKWDYVFFTGSTSVGRLVAEAIAPHLTPATLELGGKSPCVVEHTAQVGLAARRIVWGKFLNAGQTCIAPDYLLVASSLKQRLCESIRKEITKAFGPDPASSPDYARIINTRHFDRLQGLLRDQQVLIGGQTDRDLLYIAPTVLDAPDFEDLVMQDEIFGPILPVIAYDSQDELENILLRYPKPLACYIFSRDKKFTEDLLGWYSFGGGAVNDVVVHIANKKLPFGGVGKSGYGAYHGNYSFLTFSHQKSISKRGKLDIPFRYAPYKNKENILRKLLKYF